MNEEFELLEILEIEDLSDKERELAEVIGMDAYRALVKAFGGGPNVYIPKADSLTKPLRNILIARAFDGFNAYELGKKYGLTERYIRELSKEKAQEIKRKLNTLDGQTLLFE